MYFGWPLPSVRPPKLIARPRRSRIGNMTRLPNRSSARPPGPPAGRLRPAAAQRAPAEADRPAAPVADREHDAIEEQIVGPPTRLLGGAHQPGGGQHLRLDPPARHFGGQRAPALAGPAEAKRADGVLAPATAEQIF